MPTFIVESYGADGAIADQLARAERVTELSVDIRYIRTTVMPADQVLLHFFEAPSSEGLREAVGVLDLGCDRIVEVLESADHRSTG